MVKSLRGASMAALLAGSSLLAGCSPSVKTVQTPASSTATPAQTSSATEGEIEAAKLVALQAKTATLKLKFVLDGKAPTPAKIDGSKDAFCAKQELYSETLVVDKDGGIRDMLLYVDGKKTELSDVPAADLKASIVLDNKNCVFIPHVLVVRPSQVVTVKNSDDTGHNANFNFFNNEPVNFLIPAQSSKDLTTIKTDEPAPIPVECNIHPWMKAHLLVVDHPYHAISDASGAIEITGLPVGKVTFKVWHEESKIDGGEVGGKAEKWARGRIEWDLKAGVNDLGTVKIKASSFGK